MKTNSNTLSKNPDFILGDDAGNYEMVGVNKMKFNGDTYSWSSDAKGWFKDKKNENDILIYLSAGDWTIKRLREIIADHINKNQNS